MCYYNGIKIPLQEFIRLKDFEKAIQDRDLMNQELVNGFDYGNYPVLRKLGGQHDFEISAMEWGFLPPYIFTRKQADQFRFGCKDERGKWQAPFTTLNAKGEELLMKNKIFRDAALHRRCLVLSSGFYEWRHIHPVSQKTGRPLKTAQKYPYHISLKGREYFFMAGIWQPWNDMETGEYTETFAVVTTAANSLMAQIHNSKKRMPLMLTEELACEWLLGDLSEERINEITSFRMPVSELEAVTIAKDFRNAANPSAAFVYESLPPLKEIS